MKLVIDSAIFANYPEYKVGVLAVHGADNTRASAESLAPLLRAAEEQLRALIGDAEVNEYPAIKAWREAHRKFGSNPKDYPPSVQAIAKRISRGGSLPSINPLVDLYNAVGAKYILSVGGEDLDTLVGDMRLTYADGTESYREIGATADNPPLAGEVVYKDDAGIVCRKFNWREADRTKITPATKNAILLVETFPPTTPEILRVALDELAANVREYCGATIFTSGILDAASAEIVLA